MKVLGRLVRLVVAVLALVVGLAPSVASAQEATQQDLVIRKVDTTGWPVVRMSTIVHGDRPAFTDFTVRENGNIVQDIDVVPVGSTDTQVGIVLAIDTSGSMLANDAFTRAKAAAKQFVEDRAPNERIAIVAFGGRERIVTRFTTDQNKLRNAIDNLGTQRETSLWDGVRMAAGLFADEPKMQANIVVLSDGADTYSDASGGDAKAAAIARNVAVFVVGLEGDGFEEGSLRGLADDTGGVYLATADAAALDDLYESVQGTIQNQFDIVYTSTATDGPLELTIGANGMKVDATVNPFTVSQGSATRPQIVEPSDGGFFTSTIGKWMFGFLGFLAVALAVYAVVSLFAREESMLDSALRPYSDEGMEDIDDEQAVAGGSMAFMQKAVAMTGEFAEKQGFLHTVEHKLEEADLALRASEAIFFYAAGVVAMTIVGGAVTQSIVGALVAFVVTALLPPAFLNFKAAARRRQFVTQLPDMLQLLSGSLRAGYSLMQAVEAVSAEVDGPMGRELRRIVTEARLGRPLEESMDDSAERMGSADFAWAVMAIRIQREVGGNLAELLMTVAETMIARERLRREVKALTAEGRISAIVLGILPLGLGLAMYVINRPYIETLFHETVGNVMLGGAILLAGVGFWWMYKTIQIEV